MILKAAQFFTSEYVKLTKHKPVTSQCNSLPSGSDLDLLIFRVWHALYKIPEFPPKLAPYVELYTVHLMPITKVEF